MNRRSIFPGILGRGPGTQRLPSRLRLPTLLLSGALAIASLAFAAAPAERTASSVPPRPRTGRPWQDMDYGPFLTASIEASSPKTNLAYKGVAIPLTRAWPGQANEAVLFDTDLLRYAAGWTGDFVALKGVVYDGEHWAYPRINGPQVFGNPVLPGWSADGNFSDPRSYRYGPLPRERARWKGLYLHGQRVVLAMEVGGNRVLEMPGLVQVGTHTFFSRDLELPAGAQPLECLVAYEALAVGRGWRAGQELPSADGAEASTTIVLLGAPTATAQTSLDLQAGLLAHWKFEGPEAQRLQDSIGQAALLSAQPTWAEGHPGTGLQWLADSSARISPDPAIDFLQQDFSAAVWAKPTQDGVLLCWMSPEGPWKPDAKAWFIRDGRATFDVGWVGAVASSQPVPMNQWVHLAMTWSHAEGQITLYVNGATDGPQTLRPKNPLPGEQMRVGWGATNFPARPYYRGLLDDLRLYRRALAPAEIAAMAGVAASSVPLAAAVAGAPPGTRWVTTAEGQLRLRFPARPSLTRCRLMVGRAEASVAPLLAHASTQTNALPDLGALTHGGPARWTETVTTRGKRGSDQNPLAVDTITWPDDNPWASWMRFGGVDFFKDGTRAALSTWSGDVWVVSGLDDALEHLTWRRYATGLYQPLGLRIVDDVVYVLGRDQITRLHDLNGDGEADFYESFNNDVMNTEHFHEFALDLQTDSQGDFYFMKGAQHARPALHPHHGTFMKVSRDGQHSEVLARGLRAPNGLLITPGGDGYTTDQEGYWMPANRINFLRPGSFQGNNWAWLPDGKRSDFDPPVVWIHPSVDRSPSTLAWVSTPQWAPLQNRLLSFSYGVGKIFLVSTQWVDGVLQGGITPLPLEFETGLMRARFSPRDGQLYVCGLFGWAGNKTQPGGFFRIRRTSQPLQLPSDVEAMADGLVLRFLEPLDPASAADPGNYSVQSWHYRWTENYGSPDHKKNGEKGRDPLAVTAVRVARDGRTVFLQIPTIAPAMQMHVQMNLRNARGTTLQTFVHHTVHRLDPRSGASRVPDAVVAEPTQDRNRLAHERTGLVQTFTTRPAGSTDTRLARLAALYLPQGAAATPFLEPGPFSCRWAGFLKADLSSTVRFSLEGRGRASLRVQGAEVLPMQELGDAPPRSAPITLRGGLNAVELNYEAPAQGDSVLRVYWEGDGLVREPIPPAALVHEATDPLLRFGEERRLGRRLFIDRQCHQCHGASPVFSAQSAPELQAMGAGLDGAGRRFHPAWVASWLLDPARTIPGTRMPSLLTGNETERANAASDLATYLATLQAAPPEPVPPFTPSAALASRGTELFQSLGCVACHLTADAKPLAADTRRPLAHVRAKWQPAALVSFLRRPEAEHGWSRMPNFRLTEPEAQGLAAFLLAQGPEPAATPGGDAKRGRELASRLGCANCHEMKSTPQRAAEPGLAQIIQRPSPVGCLADEPAHRGAAPDFRFTVQERQALSRFLESDLNSLRRQTPVEIAEESVQTLRCTACHQREDAPDFWSLVEAADPSRQPVVNPYDDDPQEQTIHRQRPPLTLVGEKLRPEWLEAFVGGIITYKPRPKLVARMPAFPAYASWLAAGLSSAHGFPQSSPPRANAQAQLAETGSALIRKGALACVDCHAVGTQPALAGTDTVTINFAYIPERLNRHYYDRYLLDPPHVLPGTMMPKFSDEKGKTGVTSYLEGDALRQFEAIWQFMLTVPGPPAP